jgi:hypothetical protein
MEGGHYPYEPSLPRPEISPPSSFPDPSTIKVQQYNSNFYLWKLLKCPQDFPQESKDALSQVISKFVIKFFSKRRADTEALESLVNDMLYTLRRLVQNIKLNDREVLTNLLTEFNSFHSAITDLQSDKTQAIIESVKQKFTFLKVYRRFLIPDLELEREEYSFREKMFKAEDFTADYFASKFFSAFENFIQGFNPTNKVWITELIDREMQNFNHLFEKKLNQTKNSVSAYLGGLVNAIQPVRLSVMMYEVPKDAEEEKINKWEVLYERLLDNDAIELSQVVRLTNTHALIALSMKSINKLLLIEIKDFATRIISELLPDASTIIADGSGINSLVVFQNEEKHAFLGCLDEETVIKRVILKVYSYKVEEIIAAAYVRVNEEIIVLNHLGEVSNFSVKDKELTPMRQIVPTDYRFLTVSNCGRFVVLISNSETFVYTSRLELVYMDHRAPYHADIKENSICMVFMEDPSRPSLQYVAMENEALVELPKISTAEHQVDSEFRKTLRLGQELLKDFIGGSDFASINAPNLKPK